MAGRIQLVAAFFAGACLVAMAVVLSGQDKAQEPSLAAKKAMLRQASSQMLAAVTMVNGNYQKSKWPAVDISNSPQATGNKGWQWNYGSTVANDYGGALSKATAHGWTSGASTIHGYDNQVWSGGKACPQCCLAPSSCTVTSARV